jgi:phage shock protein PspC (stress-responsive transcriptional regulator)
MVRDAVRHHAGAMTTTPPTDPPADAPAGGGTATDEAGSDHRPDQGPRVTAEEVRDLGRLRRTTTDRKVAGVAGGLARHLDVDPIILRVAFVVLAFFGGAGLILYGAGWLLLPEDGDDRATLHLDERSRTIALVALTVLAGLALVGDSWGAGWFPWPLAIIGLVAFVWLSRSRERDARRAAAPAVPGDPAYAAATPYPAHTPPPRDPRKRGPRLFWFTLLLILVAEGVLAIADGAGLSVVDSAYPALAVGLVALMLVVGSVVGRAGGLIALGLLASLFLAGATAADRWDGERYTYEPTTADQVQDSYSMRTGELVLDLTGVDDLEDLDGRTVDVTGEVGRIEVLVPADLTTSVNAGVDGPGGFTIFGEDHGGIDIGASAESYGGPGAPELTIDADLSVGQITVETE